MLAIVVLAYKPQFFQLALNSIAAQTNKNFQCYIFDDAAPAEIKYIADNFQDFHYIRFDENMGRLDLVGHWHRCLELIEEEWVWLFSDDDVMLPNCVNAFYETYDLYPKATVFRFPREIVDAAGQLIYAIEPIGNKTGLEFLKSRLTYHGSCLPDHIFNWKKLKELNGGFVKFPLAWCSDDAAWCLLGKNHEIVAIPSAFVQIRDSGINITSLTDKNILKQKLEAHILFYLWCIESLNIPLSYRLLFIRYFTSLNEIIPFSYFFRLSILFQCPILILSILLMPVRKLYLQIKRFVKMQCKKVFIFGC
ncbi:MAG: glycosyltransferase family 2 protein [Fibromonadales bacterium]|nr:glycosyltransferase family 2 protein [Fibromonadales bacterium]